VLFLRRNKGKIAKRSLILRELNPKLRLQSENVGILVNKIFNLGFLMGQKRASIVGALLICQGSMASLLGTNYSINHHWDVIGDFVYMRRSKVHDHTLVRDANKPQCINRCPNYTVMSTKNLVNDFDFEPGYRAGLIYSNNSRTSFEANFMWLSEWEGKKTVHGNQSLSFPFRNSGYTQDFYNASEARGIYKSNFWDAELNYWHHWGPRRGNYFCLSGIAGFRYFHIYETFALTMVKPPDESTYHIHTANKIGAAQVGLDLQLNPLRWWSWEAFAKVGLMVDYSKVNTVLRDQNNQVKLRDFGKHKWETGIFVDVAAQFAIFLSRRFNLHAGYEVLFLSGLSLAPEQISKHTSSHSGKRDYTHGVAVIHGLYAGFGLSF
jgi:hypothetical protein